MTFGDLSRGLVRVLNQKVRSGEISQRQMARRTGFTQPHIHNVLKGARSLHADLADALLHSFELSVEDLVGERLPGAAQERVEVLRGALGPRHGFPDRADHAAYFQFAASFLARFSGPVLLRVADDEGSMSPLVEPGDLVLLDRTEDARRRPVFGSIYALALSGQGAICRCQRVGSALVLVAENARGAPRLPNYVALVRRDILDIVRGRVVWVGREFPPADSP